MTTTQHDSKKDLQQCVSEEISTQNFRGISSGLNENFWVDMLVHFKKCKSAGSSEKA